MKATTAAALRRFLKAKDLDVARFDREDATEEKDIVAVCQHL